MTYVDGFVLPLPKDRIEEYRKLAAEACEIWKDHGALEYRECVGEDIQAVEHGIPFPAALGTRPSETVVFAWILYESREHRDEVNRRVMADPRMNDMPGEMPFDVKRMLYGGFETVVEA